MDELYRAGFLAAIEEAISLRNIARNPETFRDALLRRLDKLTKAKD